MPVESKLVALGQRVADTLAVVGIEVAGKLAVAGTLTVAGTLAVADMRYPLYSLFGGKDLDTLFGKDRCTCSRNHTVQMDYTNCSFEK